MILNIVTESPILALLLGDQPDQGEQAQVHHALKDEQVLSLHQDSHAHHYCARLKGWRSPISVPIQMWERANEIKRLLIGFSYSVYQSPPSKVCFTTI